MHCLGVGLPYCCLHQPLVPYGELAHLSLKPGPRPLANPTPGADEVGETTV